MIHCLRKFYFFNFYFNFLSASFLHYFINFSIINFNINFYLKKSKILVFFNDGNFFYNRLFFHIDNSKYFIFIEIYIYNDDFLGAVLKNKLFEALKRNVLVILIIDYFGSSRIKINFFQDFLYNGGFVFFYNSFFYFFKKIKSFFYRNHRKVFIFDGIHFYCGGINIGADYASFSLDFFSRFYDSMILLSGNSVFFFIECFLKSLLDIYYLYNFFDFFIFYSSYFFFFFNLNNFYYVQTLYSCVKNKLFFLQDNLLYILNKNSRYCYFIMPYFLPNLKIINLLINMSLNGSIIRIITSGLSDIILVKIASQYIYNFFLKKGIFIYEMCDKLLHSKIILGDGLFTFIGSYNLNHWSNDKNLENGANIFNYFFSKKIKKKFYNDLCFVKEISFFFLKNRNKILKVFYYLIYNLLIKI